MSVSKSFQIPKLLIYIVHIYSLLIQVNKWHSTKKDTMKTYVHISSINDLGRKLNDSLS